VENSASALRDTARKLESIQAITDEVLAHLGLDDFLDTLLERVRQILEVDTAVVLLMERQARFLVAAAAKGLEEEVGQDVRVPVGEGFAGRVTAERRPVYTDDIANAGVYDPLLVRRGLRALLGVPLIAGGTLVGVLHVGSLTERRFTPDETEFLQVAAARIAMAMHSLLSRAERAGVLELQRSLVPTALPTVPGVEFAARYRPGKASVGGDWYDVFPLPSGEIGIVMGDVAGHGLPAAVVMGRMRSALRAYALEADDPAEVLRKLDRKFQHFEPEATATVLYAMCDVGKGRVRVSSAGHWPPVLALPEGDVRFVDLKTDVLIGLGDDMPHQSTAVTLPPGALLCFYTDGLVERRNSEISHDLSRLRDAVYAGPPEAVCAEVISALIGRERAEDDVALLLMRRTPG
jgi:serine phosphatase RsbU (regulator of sigma subunit)